MMKEIRARYSKGVIEPLEDVGLEEGEEISIIIQERPKGESMIEALRATAGGWIGLVDTEELEKNIYASRLINTRPEPRL